MNNCIKKLKISSILPKAGVWFLVTYIAGHTMLACSRCEMTRMLPLSFIEYLRDCKRSILLKRLIASVAFGYVIAGFLYGAWLCESCRSATDYPLHFRLVFGVVMAGFSIAMLGFPPGDEGGVTHLNLWPYIIGCAAIIFVIWMIVVYFLSSSRPKT